MDINTVTEIIKNVDPTQTTKYIGATVGGKMLYDDLASPTIKAAGELGAKIFKALTVNFDIWTVSFLESFTDKSMYNEIENLPIINENKEQCLQANRNFEIEKGICRLTPFGKLLISTCIK